MKIVLDGRMAQYSRTGIGAYIFNLVKALSFDTTNEIIVLTSVKLKSGGLEEIENIELVPCAPTYGAYGYREYWEQFLLPGILRRLGADVYHSPNYLLPFLRETRAALVTTLHDASLFATPQYYKFVHRTEGRFLIRHSAARANALVFVSVHAQSEFRRFLAPDVVDKGRPIYSGLPEGLNDGAAYCESEVTSVKTELGLSRPYVVAVGSVHPRKNYEGLISAMSHAALSGFDLVICGALAWKPEGVFNAIQQLGMQDRVRITGFLETRKMAALVRGARLMAFPSFYEGFGIPPLEAFALGTPVCASNTTSIPEVVGDAALLFDPESVDDMSRAILRVATDEELRVRLIANGLNRLKAFSWERCAEEHLAVYAQAVMRKGCL